MMDNSGIKNQLMQLDRKIVELKGEIAGLDETAPRYTSVEALLSSALGDYEAARDIFQGVLDKRAARERIRVAEMDELRRAVALHLT